MSRRSLSLTTLAAVADDACSECPSLVRLLPRAPYRWGSTVRLYTWATRRLHRPVQGVHTGRIDVLPLAPLDDREREFWEQACEREERALGHSIGCRVAAEIVWRRRAVQGAGA